MKKLIILFSILVFGLSLFANWVEIDSNRGQSLFSHETSDPSSIQLNFALDGYSLEQVNVNGTQYQKLTYQDESITIDEGLPSLPRFTRMIAVPETGNISVDVVYTDSTVLPDMMIYPSQSFSVEREEAGEFLMDESFYMQNRAYPENVIELSDPAVIRGYRVVSLVINPFQYNPSTRELTISRNVEISINTNNTLTGSNEVALTDKKSRAFEKYMQSIVLNDEVITTRDGEYQTPSLLFICPNSDTILENIDDLADWKHEIGYEVEVVSTSQTGTSLNTIKNYIQDAYDTWENPPEYVCLVGDANGSFAIPTGSYNGGDGDHHYTMLEGDDYLADIFIGRLSIESAFELQTIITKIFNYERTPFMGTTEWYEEAVLIGDTSSSGQTTISTNKYIKETILASNPEYTFDEEYSGNFVNAITNGLNDGAAFLNYRGYIGMSGWDNTDTEALNNGFMLPIVMILTCSTGSFSSGEARSEAFLRAGSPSTPKGAVAAVGTATASTHTCFNNLVTSSTFYALFHEGLTNMGSALTYGKTQLWIDYPTNPNNHGINFSYWNNLMGDPTMNVWGGIPQLMNVDYNDEVAVGTNFQEITVTDVNGAPVEGAWVTILKGFDQIFASAYTDASGIAVLPIDGGSNGEAKVTVTKHEYYPHRGSFELGEMDVFVNVSEVTIDDNNSGDSSGNGNGQVNPGESIELALSMGNLGANTANNVTATISCESEFVTVTDSEETYGNIDAGAESPGMDDFDIQVSPAILGSSEIKINVVISDDAGNTWNDFVFLNVKGPSLSVESYDVVGGGVINPGAIASFYVTLENMGTVFAADVNGELISEDGTITVTDEFGTFGNISPNDSGDNSTDSFEIEVPAYITPGSQIVMDLNLTTPDGYDNTVQFILEIGEVEVTDPLGSTNGRYIAIDNGDVDYIDVPIYDWIEIDPSYGGEGTSCGFNDGGNDGLIENVDLPFTMRYYGETYNTLSICSNGFVVPGETENASYMNRNIPGPMSPSPMISPFWDDLMTGSGNVFYYYDATQNRYIVQWSRIENEYNGVEETFQLVIYDPNYYTNSNADSNLLFQYKVVNNVDIGNYTSYHVEHGQFATVGIEDHTSDEGLQYTYNNTYPTAAKTLENEMAIFFTAPSGPHNEPYLVLGEISIIDENMNGQIDYAESADIFIALNNMGEAAVNNVTVTTQINDPFITLENATAEYQTIIGGASSVSTTPFQITASPDCPDGHSVNMQLDVTSDELSWTLFASFMVNSPNIEFDNIYVDDSDNHILDPGDTADVYFTFHNIGGAPAYEAVLDMVSSDAMITLNTSTYTFGTFPENSYIAAILNVTVADDAPLGYSVILENTVSGALNFSQQSEIDLRIGLINEGFETGDFSFLNWEQGTNAWVIDSESHEGNYSAKSPTISDSQDAQLSITMDIAVAGEMSFWRKVSSENNYDKLKFYINGNMQAEWSGELGWEQQTFSFAAGNITFMWEYNKDGSVSSGSDCSWIDDINFTQASTNSNLGIISGSVSLTGGTGIVEDVLITANEYASHPNSSGDYVMLVPAGSYDVEISLAGYSTYTQENVTVTVNNETTVIAALEALSAPANFALSANDNDVTLSWELPVASAMLRSSTSKNKNSVKIVSNRDRALLGFNIYRNNIMIDNVTDATADSYMDENLNGGNYIYYVKAVYDSGESMATNLEETIIILGVPQNLSGSDSNNIVSLSWTATTYGGGATSYKVYRDDNYIETVNVNSFSEEVELGEYRYFVTAMYDGYESQPSEEIILNTVDSPDSVVPAITSLSGNYPNPFNPTTTIKFALSQPGHVELKIYNIKGGLVKTLVDGEMIAANHAITWNGIDNSGRNVASGMYFYKMQSKNYTSTKKMLLLK